MSTIGQEIIAGLTEAVGYMDGTADRAQDGVHDFPPASAPDRVCGGLWPVPLYPSQLGTGQETARSGGTGLSACHRSRPGRGAAGAVRGMTARPGAHPPAQAAGYKDGLPLFLPGKVV